MTAASRARPLLFKAWRESRTRFLVSAATITTLCSAVVLLNARIRANPENVPHGFVAATYNEHIYHFIYSGTAKGLFAMLVLFIGLGGLLRERRRGTAPFTLALPVSRKEVLLSQIIVGWLELGALAALPLLLIPTLSPLVHESYPVSEALHFALLWFAGGTMIFGGAFLAGTLFSGDYTALLASFLGLFAVPLIARVPALETYQLNILMTMGEFGTMHWNANHTLLLPPPLDWSRLAVFGAIGLALLAGALIITERQDF